MNNRDTHQQELVTEKIKVLIIDKQVIFRIGLCQAVSKEADCEIFECDPDHEPIELIDDKKPDVILLDIDYSLPKSLELCRKIVRCFPSTHVVTLTANPNATEFIEVAKSGAAAYLSRYATTKELIDAIRETYLGEFPIDTILSKMPEAAHLVLQGFRDFVITGKSGSTSEIDFPLTSREKQILSYVATGYTNKEIGYDLRISEQTVKNHISSILRKMDVKDRAQAVAFGIFNGWVEPSDKLSGWPRIKMPALSS
jgi:two-component system response regulator DegU